MAKDTFSLDLTDNFTIKNFNFLSVYSTAEVEVIIHTFTYRA